MPIGPIDSPGFLENILLLLECVGCGFEGNADWVGVMNILRAGHARLACAETSPVVGASDQEPTEVAQAERQLIYSILITTDYLLILILIILAQ
jgi:hypothetical protein